MALVAARLVDCSTLYQPAEGGERQSRSLTQSQAHAHTFQVASKDMGLLLHTPTVQ
jgi:hypothetical protein